jgi:hypothetical protein
LRAAPHHGLRLFLIAPKLGRGGLLIDLLDFPLQSRNVKETPLALERAA